MKISYEPLDICFRNYEAFTVLYDLRNKQIIQLEAVSADIWNYLTCHSPTNLTDIVSFIASVYECSLDDIHDDIVDFLQDLYYSGVIQFDGCYHSSITSPSNNTSITVNDDLEGKIISSLEVENQLYSATVEMTYACNEKCIHCYAHYPSADTASNHISYEEYKNFIDELFSMGALHLSFTGGDPFMNPNFIEVFKYSRVKGFVADI